MRHPFHRHLLHPGWPATQSGGGGLAARFFLIFTSLALDDLALDDLGLEGLGVEDLGLEDLGLQVLEDSALPISVSGVATGFALDFEDPGLEVSVDSALQI